MPLLSLSSGYGGREWGKESLLLFIFLPRGWEHCLKSGWCKMGVPQVQSSLLELVVIGKVIWMSYWFHISETLEAYRRSCIINVWKKDGIVNDLSHPNFLFRTIWISYVHLGTSGAQVEALLHFLKHTQCDTLYLVGDIIDGWQLKKRFFWPQKHNDVIQKILRKARNGTKVIYIPGNHDEAAREYIDYTFGEVEIHMDYIHPVSYTHLTLPTMS